MRVKVFLQLFYSLVNDAQNVRLSVVRFFNSRRSLLIRDSSNHVRLRTVAAVSRVIRAVLVLVAGARLSPTIVKSSLVEISWGFRATDILSTMDLINVWHLLSPEPALPHVHLFWLIWLNQLRLAFLLITRLHRTTDKRRAAHFIDEVIVAYFRLNHCRLGSFWTTQDIALDVNFHRVLCNHLFEHWHFKIPWQ